MGAAKTTRADRSRARVSAEENYSAKLLLADLMGDDCSLRRSVRLGDQVGASEQWRTPRGCICGQRHDPPVDEPFPSENFSKSGRSGAGAWDRGECLAH